ncbi:MAG: M16 family metallopeptidase [Bacteroidia bacterium]
MIQFERFTLDNGLNVLVHEDDSTPMACVNILYDVGARDESEDKTGFAHLFEHLMFGGSVNISNYDEPLQLVGGENNAFTTNDLTNYYCSLPAKNIETAFWLESDRMLSLAFTPKSLEVQRNVVIEEFKQRYLNQPYGDVWLLLRPLAFKTHPYKWATIGKEIKHIEDATMEDVKGFFKKHYHPANAIMVVAGRVKLDEVKKLSEKWFGPIPAQIDAKRNIPSEPKQTEKRTLTVYRDVPADAIYMAFHMCDRSHKDYHATDIISDVLSRGNSSRLYNQLVKEKELFSDINAYVSGDRDPGLFIVSGKLNENVKVEDAEKAVWDELNILKEKLVEADELQKCKHKVESSIVFSETDILTKATNLAIFEWLGNANEINTEIDKYNAVKSEDLKRVANSLFVESNCSVLYYLKNQ